MPTNAPHLQKKPSNATAAADAVEQAETLARIHEIFSGLPFNKLLGLDIVSIDHDRPKIRFDMRPDLIGNTHHGILHGGVTSAVLDVTGGLVAFSGLVKNLANIPVEDRMQRFAKVGTIDLRIDYLRPGKGKWFEATGYPLRTGNKVAVARMELHNDSGELIAVGTGAYLVG
ncbi:MAG TPA: thioesterase family protein [Rhodocyclaceae bacterium]|nr:thioesterase family protein [Rhodocyclaceae bacterium]